MTEDTPSSKEMTKTEDRSLPPLLLLFWYLPSLPSSSLSSYSASGRSGGRGGGDDEKVEDKYEDEDKDKSSCFLRYLSLPHPMYLGENLILPLSLLTWFDLSLFKILCFFPNFHLCLNDIPPFAFQVLP